MLKSKNGFPMVKPYLEVTAIDQEKNEHRAVLDTTIIFGYVKEGDTTRLINRDGVAFCQVKETIDEIGQQIEDAMKEQEEFYKKEHEKRMAEFAAMEEAAKDNVVNFPADPA